MLLILKVCDRSQAVDQDHLRGSRGGQGFFSALSLQTRSGGFVDRMGRLLDDIFGESEQQRCQGVYLPRRETMLYWA